MADHINAKEQIDPCNKQAVTGSELDAPRNKRALDVKAPETDDRLDAILDALDTPAEVENVYDSEPMVAYNVETEIVSYTVPAGKEVRILEATGSGDNRGRYIVKVDGLPIQVKRSWWSWYNVSFTLGKEILNAGQVVSISVVNMSNSLALFEGTIVVGKNDL